MARRIGEESLWEYGKSDALGLQRGERDRRNVRRVQTELHLSQHEFRRFVEHPLREAFEVQLDKKK